jgi:hypothetical protein
MSKVRKHLKSLNVPQLRALASQRKVPVGPVVSKEALVAALLVVPNVLRPAQA